MKKYLIALLLMAFMSSNAEMIWVGIDPTIQSSSSSASIATGISTEIREDLRFGSVLSLRVVDSSANADSSTAIWYSYPINTEGVISATGLVEVKTLVDTTTDAASPFTQYGDSVMAYYTIKTGYIPYDTSTDFTLVSRAKIIATSGVVGQIAITLKAATVGTDTLFKTWTWFEIELYDSTRWGELYSQYYRIYGTGDSATTIAGTYNTVGPDFYKYWIFDPGADDDSIVWGHYYFGGDTMGALDTLDITASAQNLDSGMTINFDAGIGHTDGDTFMFICADSLHYGKQTDFTLRMGLNLLRK